MNDPRPSELAAQIAALRANVTELSTLGTRATLRAANPCNGRVPGIQMEALERALAAERRLECLIRLAAPILPARFDIDRSSYRPPGAWRAFARELSRAKRHLERVRSGPDG